MATAAEIKRELTAHKRTVEREHAARARLHAGIAQAYATGTLRMRDLVALTGFTREHLRRIVRGRGVPARRGGT